MSNIDKFITSNLIKKLDNKAAEVVSGGQGTTTMGTIKVGDGEELTVKPDPDEKAVVDLTKGTVEFIPLL